jgi:hypothetical protein
MTKPTNRGLVPGVQNDDRGRHGTDDGAGMDTALQRWRSGTVSVLVGLVLATPTEAAAACDTAAHRAFDFWLGQWQVRKPDGQLAGSNRIEREHGGCVIHERYSTGRGYSGESLNVYDATRKVWCQTWVDSAGTLLLLEGGLRDGKMVLEGTTTGTDGKGVRHRISWTPNSDGSVRQFWESTDAQGAWGTTFDGLYTRQ